MKIIVLINKKEKDYLLQNGVGFNENGLTKTTSRHSGISYYMTESRNNMRLLEKYRASVIISTKTA